MFDQLDRKLIKLLDEDARQSSEALASRLMVSSSTVRRRIRKLIKSGVLRTAALVDPVKAGLPVMTILALDVDQQMLESALKNLADRPEIKWVSTTTGRFDILVLALFSSTDELSDFMQRELASIEGLKDSETFICLQTRKGRYFQI